MLLRTSDATREIVIWDNGSTDGTAEYLATIEDPRFIIVRSETNVGFNGYARGFRKTDSHYMVELDDDVTNAPARLGPRAAATRYARSPTSASSPPTSRTTPTTRPRATAT